MAFKSKSGGGGGKKSGVSLSGSVDSASILVGDAQLRWIRDLLFSEGWGCRLPDHCKMERAAGRFHIPSERAREAVRREDGRRGKGDRALFALNMLTGTRGGSTYSEPEYAAWLEAAGFRNVRHLRMPGPASLMVANKD